MRGCKNEFLFFICFISFHFSSGIKQKMVKATKQNTLVLCVEGAMEKIIYLCINKPNRQFEFMKIIQVALRFCIFIYYISLKLVS